MGAPGRECTFLTSSQAAAAGPGTTQEATLVDVCVPEPTMSFLRMGPILFIFESSQPSTAPEIPRTQWKFYTCCLSLN